VAALLYASINWLSAGISHHAGEFLVTVVVVFFYALGGTAVLAVPVFLLLNRVNLVRWWSALAAGAGQGFLSDLLLGGHWTSPWLRGHLGLTAMGAASGLSFWLIWRRPHAA